MSGIFEAIHGKAEVVTIVLKNPYQKLRRRIFCLYCGAFIVVTYKEIALIIEGTNAAVEEITAELYCSKCKTQYEIC